MLRELVMAGSSRSPGSRPGAESVLSEADGHLSLLVHLGYVYDWLLSHL
jgi:hypothetical protein